jgi:ubiquinone/menaquinone biosynthesis C-methylase UbiE
MNLPELSEKNHSIWNANAEWWDDKIGAGSSFQTILIEPSTCKLLAIQKGEYILDIACGAGRFARIMADAGARVVAFDQSERFIDRAKSKSNEYDTIEYRVIDAGNMDSLLTLGKNNFDKAVCTMALMDMPSIEPLARKLPVLLKANGVFVFSIAHPCFNSAPGSMFCETSEDDHGRFKTENGVKVYRYKSDFQRSTEGIIGQPEPQYYFHRSIETLFGCFFNHGFVLEGIAEPCFPIPEIKKAGITWSDMPEIPPVMMCKMRLGV